MIKISRIIYVTVITFFMIFVSVLPGYAQVTETYCSTDVPVIIPDLVTVTSDLNVPDSGEITNVIVALQINHTWANDLDVSLISPQSTEVILFNDVDGSSDNFGTTCNPFPDFILDDSAALPVSAYTPGTPGSFIPQQPLSTFDSENQQGTWTLQIFDDSLADTGSLNCWCLEITIAQSVGCCLLGQADCLITTEAGCASEGGIYQGDDTACSEIQACVTRPIPTMSEWGLFATAGILGIVAILFVIVRRRKLTA
jgi:subtilisin-like proprotein convertase family protein